MIQEFKLGQGLLEPVLRPFRMASESLETMTSCSKPDGNVGLASAECGDEHEKAERFIM